MASRWQWPTSPTWAWTTSMLLVALARYCSTFISWRSRWMLTFPTLFRVIHSFMPHTWHATVLPLSPGGQDGGQGGSAGAKGFSLERNSFARSLITQTHPWKRCDSTQVQSCVAPWRLLLCPALPIRPASTCWRRRWLLSRFPKIMQRVLSQLPLWMNGRLAPGCL